MSSPISVNVGIRPAQLWSGRSAPGVNTLLLMNTDQVNTVMVGTSLNSLVVPIQPNGSLSVDPGENWYVTGLVAGTAPLVVVPNGQGNFLGLTQGYGTIAIPQFQSPDFSIAGQTGWAIFQNGDAYFFNVIAKGNVTASEVVGTGQGKELLAYTGQPSLTDLVASISGIETVDAPGNTIYQGITAYGSNGSRVQLQPGTFGNDAVIILQPPSATVAYIAEPPEVFSSIGNAGTVNEYYVASLFSGVTYGNPTGFCEIDVISGPENGSFSSAIYFNFNSVRQLGIFATGFSPGKTLIEGNLPINNANTNAYNNNNSTSLVQLSEYWPIPANDAQLNTCYRITCIGSGSTAGVSEPVQFELMINGTGTGLFAFIPSASLPVSSNWSFRIVLEVLITSTGASGTYTGMVSGTAQKSESGTAGAFAALSSNTILNSIDTTSAFTIGLGAAFAVSQSGQTVTGFSSIFERLGP